MQDNTPKQATKEELWSNSRKLLKEIIDQFFISNIHWTETKERLADTIEREFGPKLKKLEELETLGLIEVCVRLPQIAEWVDEKERELERAYRDLEEANEEINRLRGEME